MANIERLVRWRSWACFLLVLTCGIAARPVGAPTWQLAGELGGRFQCTLCSHRELGRPAHLEYENGKIVAYRGETENSSEDQVEIHAASGVLSLNVLKQIQGASRVAMWDVSVGPTGLIAIAAVAISENGTRASLLMTYSNSGALLKAISLSRGIHKVAVDRNENVWILWQDGGETEPALRSLISMYDPKTGALRDFIPRSEFPDDAKILRQGRRGGGIVSFAVAGEEVWAYLPAAKELLTMRRDGTGTKIRVLGDPEPPRHIPGQLVEDLMVLEAYWLPPDRLIARVFMRYAGTGETGICEWSQAKGKWRRYPITDVDLLGAKHFAVENGQLVFLLQDQESPVLTLRTLPIPSPEESEPSP